MKIAVLDKQTLTDGDISLNVFENFGEVEYAKTLKGNELIGFIKDKDAVLLNRSILTSDILKECSNLKYVGVFATGYNNVDIAYCKENGITVCNVPGYSTESVVQLTVSFILMLACNTESYSKYVKDGLWSFTANRTYFPFNITRLKNRTLGIIGMGNMGTRLAEIMSVFGMNIIYYSRTKKDLPYKFVSKEELFERSDFISLHCPVNNETKEIVNKESLALCKKGVYIVNTSRGGLVNEEDIVNAINSGIVQGYAADVVLNEPLDDNSPLFTAKNTIFTPHIAWADRDTRKELIELVAKNLECFTKGKPINKIV